jgi:hypothetical protein
MLTAGRIDDILSKRNADRGDRQSLLLRVLGDPDIAAATLRSLPDITEVAVERGLITFTFHKPVTSNPDLLRELLSRDVAVVTIAPATQNLEDIFLDVTKGVIA